MLVESVVDEEAVDVVTVVAVVEVFVTGAPVPVSVAVVPVAVDCTVSVAVLSAGFPRPQALQSEINAMMLRILRIRTSERTKSNRRARLARDVNDGPSEVQYG